MVTDPTMDSGQWLEWLRRSLVRIAKRRVAAADVEDVVQDAMRVVVERNIDPESGEFDELPPVAWCFRVLHHTIGNYYQKETTRRKRVTSAPNGLPVEPGAAGRFAAELDSRETAAVVEKAVERLGRDDAQCAAYLTALVEGHSPRRWRPRRESIQPCSTGASTGAGRS